MPLLKSTYRRPFFLVNGHLETIWPALTRKVKGFQYERERLELSDGDFVDLDWLDKGSRQLVLLTHGLEGDSERHYTRGMAKYFAQQNWDVLAWNCRSCSGEMNRSLRMYNHGEIEDIAAVIQHALQTKDYEKIVLVGFSMGGAINFKYLGVNAGQLPDAIYKAVAFSTPCDLEASAHLLDLPGNRVYKKRFLEMLRPKIEAKAKQYPGVIDVENYEKIGPWRDFDNFYTAPLNGYKDADDFYHLASCINWMHQIDIPYLLVNAQNDPILSPECSPKDLLKTQDHYFLETPKYGGHVGFSTSFSEYAWSEKRAWDFVQQ